MALLLSTAEPIHSYLCDLSGGSGKKRCFSYVSMIDLPFEDRFNKYFPLRLSCETTSGGDVVGPGVDAKISRSTVGDKP